MDSLKNKILMGTMLNQILMDSVENEILMDSKERGFLIVASVENNNVIATTRKLFRIQILIFGYCLRFFNGEGKYSSPPQLLLNNAEKILILA